MNAAPLRVLLGTAVVLAAPSVAGAQEAPPRPWRLDEAIGGPSWVKFSGRHRTRYESLNKQFRAGNLPEDEDQWFTRTSLRADLDFGTIGGTAELMDSRAWGDNPNRLTNTGFVNTTDFVELNGIVHLGAAKGRTNRLLVGRYTMSLGSRRFVIRNGFRNTVNTFTGVDYLWRDDQGQQLRLFWTMPVRRRPFDAPSLRDNDFEWDDQDKDLQFFGIYGVRNLDEHSQLEAFVFGLHEDAADSQNRRLMTPGVRYHRPARKGAFFGEAEAAFQIGQSQAQSGASPTLDHTAWFAHASIGYRWDCPCDLQVRLAYDYATGDRDPNDGENNRFDRLYGAPRFEYCPTGLWGAIQRSNFKTPELRVSFRPTKQSWIMLAYRNLELASATDQWVGSGVRDASGASGDNVGQQYELRARYDLLPGNMFLEVGGAYLVGGSFLDRAPNSPSGGDRRYGFVEMRWTF
ncbi:MAG: alginate export family protein [Planctomycetes bacterium]|nr:alginate export family protein [Planctomycetota bacterium]